MVLLALTAIAPLWDAGRQRNFCLPANFLGGEFYGACSGSLPC
jgi:hypothetical protein